MTPNRHNRQGARALRAEAAAAVLASFLLAAGGAAAQASASPLTDGVRAGSLMGAADAVKYYVVGKERDGKPEFLFSIAEKVLGDGSRFNEIFELNKNRVQADGGVLTQPTAIEAGWVLQLPDDAAGEGVRVGELPTAGSASPTPTPVSPTPATPQPQAAGSSSDTDGSNALTPVLGVGAAVLVSGAVGGYALRRRRPASPTAPVTATAASADPLATAPPESGPGGQGARRAGAFVAPEAVREPEPAPNGRGGTAVRAEREGRRTVSVSAPASRVTAAPASVAVASSAGRATVTASAVRTGEAAPAGQARATGTAVQAGAAAAAVQAPVAATAVARRSGVRGNGVRAAAPIPPTTALIPAPLPDTIHTFHVVFGDDLVDITLATGGGSEADAPVAWMPLPYDIPEGDGAFLCIGASDSDGCLFLDLARAPGAVAVGGDTEAARRLLESLVLQLGVSPALDQASAIAVGALAGMAEGLARVERATSLGEIAARRAEEAATALEFVFGILDSEADHAALSDLLRGPGRVVPIVLGEPETAAWTFTVRPAPTTENPQ